MSAANDIRDHVAVRNLPRAAFESKQALDRGAHAQFAAGVLLGLGQADVDERSAAAVCACFLDLLTSSADGRRDSAARLLMTSMRAIVAPLPAVTTGGVVVNAAGADIAMAQPCPLRAAAFAGAMAKAMPCCDVADTLAKACARVSSLHGTARNPDALRSFARCPLFRKPGVAVQAAAKVLLVAAVRSAYVMAPLPASCTPELQAALAATPNRPGPKAVPKAAPDDHPDDAGEYQPSTDEKLTVLWTFVSRDDSAAAEVARAAEEAFEEPELKVIDGRGLLPPSGACLARVRHVA